MSLRYKLRKKNVVFSSIVHQQKNMSSGVSQLFQGFSTGKSAKPRGKSAKPRGSKSNASTLVFPILILGLTLALYEKNSRRLWQSQRGTSSGVPEGEANFPAAVLLAGKVQTLAGIAFRAAGKSVWRTFQQRRDLRENLSSKEFWTATAFSSLLTLAYPKHLLGQHFPSKRKLGELSLRGKIFPLRDNFPLRIAFPFPQNGQFSHEMKGLRKGVFMAWGIIYDFPPRGKIYPKPIFCLKRCYG